MDKQFNNKKDKKAEISKTRDARLFSPIFSPDSLEVIYTMQNNKAIKKLLKSDFSWWYKQLFTMAYTSAKKMYCNTSRLLF